MLDKLRLLAEYRDRKQRELEYLLSLGCRIKILLRGYYEEETNS